MLNASSTRWTLAAWQAAWVLAVLLSIVLLVFLIPQFYHRLSQPCPSPCQYYGGISLADLPRLQAIGLSLRGYAFYQSAVGVVGSLGGLVVSVFIAARRWRDRQALTIAILLVLMGLFVSGDPGLTGWSARLEMVAGALQATGLLLFIILFPDGRFVPAWARWVVTAWLLLNLSRYLAPVALFFSRYPELDALQWFTILFTALGSQVYRYRRVSDAVQRQQTKWLVTSLLLAFGITLPVALMDPPAGSPLFLALVGMNAVIFLSIYTAIAFAILRHRLWEIDFLIRKTLAYSLLTALLALVYLGSVAVMQSVVTAAGGRDSALINVLSTLAIAALFSPLRRRVQAAVDGRFYRRKYDAERALGGFSTAARSEIDLDLLSARLVGVVDETLQPRQVSLWMRPAQRQPAPVERQPLFPRTPPE